MGDPVKEEMGVPYMVDGLDELSRGLVKKEVLNPVHAPKAQAGFPGLASAHKSWVGLWWVRVGDGGPVTSEVVREADWRDLGSRHVGVGVLVLRALKVNANIYVARCNQFNLYLRRETEEAYRRGESYCPHTSLLSVAVTHVGQN